VQLHWIRIEDIPRIWEAIEGVGLSTCEACGDTPRNFLGCPLAGVDAEEIIDATPWLMETHRRFVGDPQFSNLPRKFKTSISGCAQQCGQHEINDIGMVGTIRDGELGFDVWVGGGLGPNPRFGQRLGVFLEPDLIPDVWAGIAGVFRDYGYRRARNHARLKFLMADWGPERFRQVLEKEYLGFSLPDGSEAPPSRTAQRDHLGVRPQRDGRSYVGFAPRAGRIFGHQLRHVAGLAERYGGGRIRATTQQKLVILDVAPDNVDALVAELEDHDLRVNPSVFRRGTMACTGIEFCKLAIVETKGRGASLIDELERRLPEFDEPLTINLNGCPNACARIQVADIGLKGQLVLNDKGEQVEGFQVHLGGALGLEAGFGRKVRGLKVTSEELPDYVERVLKRFQAEREDGERFAAWASRASEEALS
jgi:sulfite reductase (ferredoxin)